MSGSNRRTSTAAVDDHDVYADKYDDIYYNSYNNVYHAAHNDVACANYSCEEDLTFSNTGEERLEDRNESVSDVEEDCLWSEAITGLPEAGSSVSAVSEHVSTQVVSPEVLKPVSSIPVFLRPIPVFLLPAFQIPIPVFLKPVLQFYVALARL